MPKSISEIIESSPYKDRLKIEISYGEGPVDRSATNIPYLLENFLEDGPQLREQLILSWKPAITGPKPARRVKVWKVNDSTENALYYNSFYNASAELGTRGGLCAPYTIEQVELPEGAITLD